jgi:hypothetical protein
VGSKELIVGESRPNPSSLQLTPKAFAHHGGQAEQAGYRFEKNVAVDERCEEKCSLSGAPFFEYR